MYYDNIMNNELQVFHKSIQLSASYTELNNLGNEGLFNKTRPHKLVPKFYTKEIAGNNNIKNINSQLVLYNTSEDLNSLSFNGEKENASFDVIHRVSQNTFLILHLFDSQSLFCMMNLQINVQQIIDNTVVLNVNLSTDEKGNAIVKLNRNAGKFVITNKKTGQIVEV